jgi:hypothetical protein
MAINWVTPNIRKRSLETWETRLANCEVTPQAIWPIAKSLMERSGPNSWSLKPHIYPIGKANTTVGCLENQFTAHNLCDCDHRKQVEAKVQALLANNDEGTPVKFRPCGTLKEIQYLKLEKACGLDGILASSKTFYAFNTCIQLLPSAWSLPGTLEGSKNHEVCRNPAITQNCPKIYVQSATIGKLFEKLILRTIQEHTE